MDEGTIYFLGTENVYRVQFRGLLNLFYVRVIKVIIKVYYFKINSTLL